MISFSQYQISLYSSRKDGTILVLMSLPKVTTKLINISDASRVYEDVFLVDTEATDSMAPAVELEKIGLHPEGKMAYELADGSVREYPYGLARIEFMGEADRVPDHLCTGRNGTDPRSYGLGIGGYYCRSGE